MNVEIGAEAAIFPEKDYINGIFVAVHTVESDGRQMKQYCQTGCTVYKVHTTEIYI
jgi:hypothetical protein